MFKNSGSWASPISPQRASPEGEGFLPSPKGTLINHRHCLRRPYRQNKLCCNSKRNFGIDTPIAAQNSKVEIDYSVALYDVLVCDNFDRVSAAGRQRIVADRITTCSIIGTGYIDSIGATRIGDRHT